MTPSPGAPTRCQRVRRHRDAHARRHRNGALRCGARRCRGGLLLLAILIQLTVLNNLRLPGGAGPDLVLVVVVALSR